MAKKVKGATVKTEEAVPAPEVLISSKDNQPITIGFLVKILMTLPPHLPVSVAIPPDFEECPVTDAVLWPKHGGLFLVGTPDSPADDDDLPECITGEWVEVPKELKKERYDPDIAEEV